MSQSSDETRTNIGWGYAKDEQQFGKDLRDHPAFNSTTLPRSLTFSFTTDKTHLEIVPDPSGSFILTRIFFEAKLQRRSEEVNRSLQLIYCRLAYFIHSRGIPWVKWVVRLKSRDSEDSTAGWCSRLLLEVIADPSSGARPTLGTPNPRVLSQLKLNFGATRVETHVQGTNFLDRWSKLSLDKIAITAPSQAVAFKWSWIVPGETSTSRFQVVSRMKRKEDGSEYFEAGQRGREGKVKTQFSKGSIHVVFSLPQQDVKRKTRSR